jgi:hypothetical protein
VPLQGHWDRVNTPLRKTTRRERRIVAVVGGLVAVAVIVSVIVAIGASSPATPAGCIKLEVASTMGGGATQLCGNTAREFCASPAAHHEQGYLAKCRGQGYAVTPQ